MNYKVNFTKDSNFKASLVKENSRFFYLKFPDGTVNAFSKITNKMHGSKITAERI